ncbi:outer envelope pore protein 16-chloroplastic mitochondrial-like [Phytophthora cinnamomi]|uniref:outer envelope pore protein 16-chloroplastic mitochondrial-like n=1 Tax=Phytophthora cinnamomi TaxID=4785 RepID=UPI00355AC89F|nr:outer envelope pore protein 16-chloroplastic mitochondrial-like [Phytophthora cinnamomi]
MDAPAGSEKIMYTTAAGAFFGAAIGSVESVWAIPKLGAKLPKLSNQLKHLGTRSLVFAAVGCIFTTGEYVTASIRQKEDPISAGVGGALVGVVPGMVKQSMRVGVASGVAAGAAMAAASYWQAIQDSPLEKYAAARHADRS